MDKKLVKFCADEIARIAEALRKQAAQQKKTADELEAICLAIDQNRKVSE
jgi:hypothetical protein